MKSLLAAIAFIVALPAEAAPLATATLAPADQTDLKRVETYLDGIKTLAAQFQQTNDDGSTASGKVWLSRPGKMRFEYAPPVEMTIISNGDYVAVDDKELKQVQFYPVESTPVWFLLREGIKLSGDVTVTGFERGPESLRITCVQTKDPHNGSITLVFSDAPLALRQWSVLDVQGRTTSVALSDEQAADGLDAKLFKLPPQPNQHETPGQQR